MKTKYWSKKQTFFSHKCEDQRDMNDGRQLRKYTNPQTNEPGEVWEYQSQERRGIPESLYIDHSQYGDSLCLGLQGEGYVDVLQFKLYTSKGGLTKDIAKLARVIGNIDFSKELVVSIWENFQGAEKGKDGKMHVPVYLMFKPESRGKSYPSTFPYIEGEGYQGVPPLEVREGMGGKKIYDSVEQDKFYFSIIEKAIADNKAILDQNKASRPKTEAESAPPPSNNIPQNDDIEEEDQVPS